EFVFTSGTLTIGDSDPGDVLKWGIKTLTGNDKPECDDPDPMVGKHGETYSVGGDGTLTVTLPDDGGTIRIKDWRNEDVGITIHEETDECKNDADEFKDPIVIDLNSDGVRFFGLGAALAFFDFDSDGFAEQTAWASPEDGILSIDLNGDGMISTAAEIFAGDTSAGYEAGYQALRVFDENGDGVIDANDTVYTDLLIWQDLNSDGVSDEGELQSLADWQISSISLTTQQPFDENPAEGVQTVAVGSVTFEDGSLAEALGVNFSFDAMRTLYQGEVEIDPETASLPYLNGYGQVRDLDVAMSEDPALKAMVQSIATMGAAQAGEFTQAVEQFILRWHRVEGVIEDGRGKFLDGQHLAAMEKLWGSTFTNNFVTGTEGNPRAETAQILAGEWDGYSGRVAARLLAQSDLGEVLFPELRYVSAAALIVDDATSVADVMARIVASLPEDGFDKLSFLKGMTQVLNAVREQFTEQGAAFDVAVAQALTAAGISYSFDQLRLAKIAMDGGDLLVGDVARSDLHISGTGDDIFKDAGGTNTIIFGQGHGDDLVLVGYSENWELDLVGLNRADISIEYSDSLADAIITVLATGETITFAGMLSGGIPVKNVTVTFADGTTGVIGEGILSFESTLTDGDDVVTGTDGDDVFEGSAGNDTFSGGEGEDTYKLDEGQGNNTVNETGDNSGVDQVQIAAAFAEVTVDFGYSPVNGELFDNLILTLADGSSITVLQTDRDTPAVEKFVFEDVTLSYDQLRVYEADQLALVLGDVSDQSFANSVDDETFFGEAGSDSYEFGPNTGSDVIWDSAKTDDVNTLTVQADFDDVILESRTNYSTEASQDLILRLADGSTMTIINNSLDDPSVHNFIFADHTLSYQQILPLFEEANYTLKGTDGDDTLVAEDVPQYSYEENVLIGRGGNDYLDGGKEADTYIYNAGDGSDTIYDDGSSSSSNGIRVETDKLVVHGISPDDVSISRIEDDNDDLILTFGVSGETIRIEDQLENRLPSGLGVTPPAGSSSYSSVSSSEIEEIIFDDGTVWTVDGVRARLLEESATDGDDTINGFDEANDTIEAGLGDDIVSGLEGSDTIVFNLGDGNDTINESVSGEGTDTLKLVGIDRSDLVVTRNGNDLVLTFTSSPSDSIRLVSQLGNTQVIERVEFDDGAVLSDVNLSDLAFQALATSSSEIINGTNGAENLFLSGGDDTLSGGGGNDVYVRSADTTGNDRLEDDGINSFDTLRLEGVNADEVTVTALGDDVVLTLPNGSVTLVGQTGNLGWNVIEQIEFGNGDIWDRADITAAYVVESGTDAVIEGDEFDNTLTGTSVDETLNGLAGNDNLSGGGGSDLYLFGRGSGNDRIADGGDDPRYSVDRVQLTDLNPEDVTLSRISTNEMKITINNTDETLILEGIYQENSDAIEFVEFADGTVWDQSYLIKNAWWRGTDGDDVITASQYYNNIVYGGQGNDILEGGFSQEANAPVFIFNVGDGNDYIEDYNGRGTIILHGVTEGDLNFVRDLESNNPLDLIIRYSGNDQIRVRSDLDTRWSQLEDFRYGFTKIVLDDGTEITRDEAFERTVLIGSDGDDTIISVTSAVDTDTTFYDEVIDAGTGDDIIDGGDGSDTYLWRLGDGNDMIVGSSEAPESNTLKFTDVASGDVTLSRDGDNLLVMVNSSGEVVTAEDQFYRYSTFSAYGVGQIEFSDGVVISRSDLERQYPDDEGIRNIFGTSGDDNLQGSSEADLIETGDGNDVLDGLAGDDELYGGNESDIYLWRPGSGNDIIDDDGYQDGDIDTIRIENANFTDFTIGRSPEYGNDLRLTHNLTGETLTLSYQLSSWAENIERIEFADGAVLFSDDLKANYPYVGTAGADNLGSADYDSDDTFQGLAGDDRLEGGLGSDTYVWQVGDGNDTIVEPSLLSGEGFEGEENGSNGAQNDLNILRLSGVVVSDITLQRDTANPLDLIVAIAASGEQIRLLDQLSISEGLIQKIVLDDDSEISLAGLAETLPITGTSGDDYLQTGLADETIDAKQGDDIIESGSGSDTIMWRSGDGNDEVIDQGLSGDQDILRLVDIALDGIVLVRGVAASDDFSGDPTVDDLVVTITATGETIVVRGQFATGDEFSEWNKVPGIEQIEFSDGSVLSRSEITEQLNASGGIVGGTEGDDILEGSTGNDVLVGGEGNDSYQFDRGAAEDVIVDSGGENDFVEFGAGVTPESLTLQRIGDDLLIEVGGLERLTLTIAGQFDEYSDQSIEGIRFADGLEWSANDIKAILINESTTNGDDTIEGFDSDDVIRALGGNDLIIVGDGNDAVDGGNGYDTVELTGSQYRFDIETTENGYIVTDTYTDEVKHLTNVETIRFSYGDDLVLEENTAPTAGAVTANGYEDRVTTILASDILSQASDADGETMSLVSVDGAVNGTVALDADGNVAFTPDNEFSGEASFTYEITDGTNTVSDTVIIAIAAVNDAPVIANEIPDQEGIEDAPFSFVIPEDTFSDVDSSELTLSATLENGAELPDWLSFDATSRTFSGNPPANFNGVLPVVVVASDGLAATSTRFAFNLAPINDAPVAVSPIEDRTVEAGEPASISIPIDAFVDMDGDNLLYSATQSDGSVLPEWLSIDPFTGEFTGTPPAGTDQTYSITITASDGTEEASSSFDLTVNSGNQAPVVDNPIADQSSAEDVAISFTLPEDTFSDPDGDAITLSATLADSTPLPAWLSFDADTRTFFGTPPQDFNGILEFEVTATDGALSASDNFQLTINAINDAPVLVNAMADQSFDEDSPVNFAVPAGTFSDVEGDALVLSATMGDGSELPSWLAFDGSGFTGTPPANFHGVLA
ncbi:MAG: tandem-95 repeat protein, partial [bacterium]|nr:tandem-95 repeat protein [bacterium]